ncbi:MAG: methylmalonyl-CoA mutase family protein [Bacteroidota bacterium]
MAESFRDKSDFSFSSTNKSQWKEKLSSDLKGKSIDGVLLKQSSSDFQFETYRDPSNTIDVVSESLRNALNGKYADFGTARFWYNRVTIPLNENSRDNSRILELLQNGVNGIILSPGETEDIDFNSLLKDVDPSYCEISIETNDPKLRTAFDYFDFINKSHNPSKIAGTLSIKDPSFLFDNLQTYRDLVDQNKSANFKVFNLPSRYFHDKGFSPVEEIAFTLSLLVDLIEKFEDPDKVLPNIEITTSAGVKYFEEIAKIRALRYLVQEIANAYGLSGGNLSDLNIHSTSSTFYNTIHDEHNNLLRNTSSAISAILGGADALTILPHDALFSSSNYFSARIAKNISCLLSDESHFDKNTDPVAGSYFIEQMTDHTAKKAWAKFQDLENEGGFLNFIKKGSMENLISEKKELWKDRLVNHDEILVGFNKYQAETDIDDEKLGMFKESDSVANYIEP